MQTSLQHRSEVKLQFVKVHSIRIGHFPLKKVVRISSTLVNKTHLNFGEHPIHKLGENPILTQKVLVFNGPNLVWAKMKSAECDLYF